MKIDQQLLLACAAYLAHERAYDVPAAAEHGPLVAVGLDAARRRGHVLYADDASNAEALVLYHISAIRARGARRGHSGVPLGCEAVAKAILDAAREPHMTAWWCATLQADSQGETEAHDG